MSFSISEYTRNDVGWGFSSDPTGGAYNTPQTVNWFEGRTGMKEDGREGLAGKEELGDGGRWGWREMKRGQGLGWKGKGNSALVVKG